MAPESKGSVTRLIERAKLGGDTAAKHLLDRYFERLVQVARNKLRAKGHRGGAADEHDAAASAFDSFCLSLARGRFPKLSNRDDLWRLLAVLTLRKASDLADRENAEKRGGVFHSFSSPAADHDSATSILIRRTWLKEDLA
jgi:hypothetical protein